MKYTDKHGLERCDCDATHAAIKARDERIQVLEDEISWVLNDAMYKAPEQFGSAVYQWLSRLQLALLPSNQAPVAGEGT